MKKIFLSLLALCLTGNTFTSDNGKQAAQSPNYWNIATTVGFMIGIGAVQKSERAQALLKKIGYGKEEATVALGANALAAAFTAINPTEYGYFIKWTPVATVVAKVAFSDIVAQAVNKTPLLNTMAPDAAVERVDKGAITDAERASRLGGFYLGVLGYQALRSLLPHDQSPVKSWFQNK